MARTAKPVLLRLSDREREMVEELAQQRGLSLSDVVRQAVREEYLRRIEVEKRVA